MRRNKKLSQYNSQQQDDDQYTKQQQQIIKTIQRFKQKKKPSIQKQLNHLFYQYETLLDLNYASPAKWEWLKSKKVLITQVLMFKNQLTTQNQQQNTKQFVTVNHIKQLHNQNDQQILKINQNLQQAIQISTQIRLNLDQKIQKLDLVYQTNKDTKFRLKRALNGLKNMMRNIMLSKMTKFLTIITILALITLIIFYILKQNGINVIT